MPIDPIPLMSGSVGLDNSIDAIRLSVEENSIRPLSETKDIEVDAMGRISRRQGYTATVRTEAWDCLHSYRDICLGVSGGKLYRIGPALDKTELLSLDGQEVGYADAGAKIWLSDGHVSRVISSSLASWPTDNYVGPDVDTEFTHDVKGVILEYSNGRIFAADGTRVNWTERYEPGLADRFKGHFNFPGEVRILANASNGLWVSDDEAFWWFDRAASPDQSGDGKSTFPGVKGTKVTVDTSVLNLQELSSDSVGSIALGQKGICLLGPRGFFKNLTGRRIEFRDENSKFLALPQGCAVIRRDQYIVVASPIAVTMNLSNRAVGQLTGWNFKSFCRYNEMVLGASSSGIFDMTGDDDDGTDIDAYFQFDFQTENPCRFRKLYIDGEFGSRIVAEESVSQFKVTLTSFAGPHSGAASISQEYSLEPSFATNNQARIKVPVRRDNGRSKYWRLKFENLNGEDFSIDDVSALPIWHMH